MAKGELQAGEKEGRGSRRTGRRWSLLPFRSSRRSAGQASKTKYLSNTCQAEFYCVAGEAGAVVCSLRAKSPAGQESRRYLQLQPL